MKILIDNGHGSNTVGKRSPDGRLMEWRYAREIARGIVNALRTRGYDAMLLTPEETDVSLSNRVLRANQETRRAGGAGKCVLVSIHCNAAGKDGRWHAARGWGAYVGLKASKRSKLLAKLLASEAEQCGLRVRKPSPEQPFWTQNLAVCRDTLCPAVLTENLFQDNREDVAYLLSGEGRATIIRLHVEAIERYIRAYS
jgi:N-acetylmuramoyl-L-alanine amidase